MTGGYFIDKAECFAEIEIKGSIVSASWPHEKLVMLFETKKRGKGLILVFINLSFTIFLKSQTTATLPPYALSPSDPPPPKKKTEKYHIIN